MSESVIDQAKQGMERYFFRASAEDFKKIPGNPIAYWITHKQIKLFNKLSFGDKCYAGFGIKTGNNQVFMRFWHEVNLENIEFNANRNDLIKKWYPCASGGSYRKWYGNQELVVDYQNGGENIEKYAYKNGNSYGFGGKNYYFRESITWPKLTSGENSFRITPCGHVFDGVGLSAFFETQYDLKNAILFLNSKICAKLIPLIAPTLSLTSGDFLKLPFPMEIEQHEYLDNKFLFYSKSDWDSYEFSWSFGILSLLRSEHHHPELNASYQSLRTYWRETTLEMRRIEEENNRIFIEAYGLQDELTPDVPLEEITLTCNPHYRYGGNKTEAELEALLLQDTMAEFCSYAVGCMFGRYSLDKPGLVLANQGETLQDYLQQVPQPSFRPDEDNVIPLLDADWFADDVTGRFLEFLRVTFGTEHFAENLAFVERGLNIKNKRNYSIRDFFVKEFYDYHIRMYKKRPIYWLFASPRGTFQALVYLHRYRPDTVSVVLRYLREFRDKLAARRQLVEQRLTDASASQGEKTRLTKELEQLRKQILELDDYEHDVLFPLAGQRLEIDLDDGVKANYPKFGKALKKIGGL